MSYRTFKRALGETNLERKCRLLFGTCLLVLISGSFWWYGSETDKIVYDLNRRVGNALVNVAIFDAHKSVYVTREGNVSVLDSGEKKTNDDIADLLRSRNFDWDVRHPDNDAGLKKPVDDFEWGLMDEWKRFGESLKSDQDITAAFDDPENQKKLGRERPDGDSSKYTYYQPVFAKQKCIGCHNAPSGLDVYWPNLKVGDLLAVYKIEMDTKDTQNFQAQNRSLLITLGVVTVFLAMAALYVIVRYVIVKPLAHLRDVSDAVRRGDIEQRAVIHTGDEFEELGAAFNRMLRQLLRQQDELRNVNDELDGKIDELAQVNMRLFEMNQVKSDFLATVSHELRTPLNSILGFSDLLAKGKSIDDRQRRYAANIERSGRQLLDMINDILDLAKIESGRMEVRPTEFDIGVVVLTQCDLARPLSERKHIELDCEIAPGLEPIRQDQGKIEQVLNNLLSNAIKFTPDGGRIHVSARRDRRGDLRLTVADTGVGISESEQVAVFEKFRQGSNVLAGGNAMTREYSGSGLGLSIVRELCRLLGGDVTLESELGKGSEFTVILPWSVAEQNRIESPLADELRQLAKARSDGPFGKRRRRSLRGWVRRLSEKLNHPNEPGMPPATEVQLYTDGACSGNPGPGGWAFLLVHPATGKTLERSGGERLTTNNRMELQAVIEGLSSLKRPARVELFTDSVYVGKGLCEYMPKWKANGWRRKEGTKFVPVKNEELWRRLDELLARHQVKYTRVAGHSGHIENDRVDELAVAAYQRFMQP